jgi:hypothetical protein
MPTRTTERPMTNIERESIQEMLQRAATPARRRRQGIENAFVTWAALMLALTLAWLGLAWIARNVFNLEVGWRSSAALWIVGVGALISAIIALRSTVRWMKQWTDHRPLIRADLDAGLVSDEHYAFTGAKRFQESEYGGLIYFFRTDDGQVLTVYDSESQDLGASGEDPLKSRFVPRVELVMVRAPKSGLVLDKRFSGTPFDTGNPVEIVVNPRDWPESEQYCMIPWDDLESRLGGTQSS